MAISKYGNYIGKPERGIQRTQLTLKKELREALDQYAKDNNMKLTHIIEALIQEHIVDVATNQEKESK